MRVAQGLRRSRRQKSAIKSLAGENARLRKAVKGARRRIEALEAQLARLRSTGAVLSRKLFGRKSEQQDKPRSQRQRGQQRGAPGHGRTRRPGLEERPEVHAPPPEACACAQLSVGWCGGRTGSSRVSRSLRRREEVLGHCAVHSSRCPYLHVRAVWASKGLASVRSRYNTLHSCRLDWCVSLNSAWADVRKSPRSIWTFRT